MVWNAKRFKLKTLYTQLANAIQAEAEEARR